MLYGGCAGNRDRRCNVGDHDFEAVRFDAVGLALLVVGGDGNCVGAVVREVVADRRVGRAGREHRRCRSVTPINGDVVAFRVGVADRQCAREPLAFVGGSAGAHFQAWPVVHIAQGDVGKHRGRGEGDPVGTGPAELVEAEEVQFALIGQQACLQICQPDFLAGHDFRCAQAQRTVTWQGDDFDCLQGLAVRIAEGSLEQRTLKHDDGFFQATDADVGNFRRGVAEALQADVVAVAAPVRCAISVLVGRVGVAGVGDDETTIGHCRNR